jgi:hypothetical protein
MILFKSATYRCHIGTFDTNSNTIFASQKKKRPSPTSGWGDESEVRVRVRLRRSGWSGVP